MKTVKCEQLEERLVIYHYSECSAEEQKTLEEHLAGCGRCGDFLHTLRTLLPLAAQQDEPPESFWQDYSREALRKLDAQMENTALWKRPLLIIRRWQLPAFAVLGVVMLAFYWSLFPGSRNIQEAGLRESEIKEVAPIVEHIDFLSTMELLDSMEILEALEEDGRRSKAESRSESHQAES